MAVADGTVVVAEDLFFTGNAVFVDHGNGLIGMYFHLSEIKVQAGQDVKKGQTLGLTGSTGRVTGPHLHFGSKIDGRWVNPQSVLSLEFRGRALSGPSTPAGASPGTR